MRVLDAAFKIRQTVYLKTDPEQLDRIVTGYNIRPHGDSYLLSCKTEETPHYDFEISAEKDILKSTSN